MITFSPEAVKRFEKIIEKYEIKDSALLPTLYLAQDEFGFLSDEALNYVASLLSLPPSHVYDVASFYTLFKRKPTGRYWIQVCQNITCHMMGSEKLLCLAKKKLNLSLNEMSEDKRFTLSQVQCLGSCDTAPVVQVNDDYHENMTIQKFETILEGLK